MKISIATVFSQLYTPFLQTSLIKRAQDRGLITVNTLDLFDCVDPKKRIDSPSFGPGAGMVLKPDVIETAVTRLEKEHGSAFKIFFSPRGKKLTQSLLKEIVAKAQERGHMMLLPARYEGMDARVESLYADEIVSVGDFVLMGGDLPAMMLLEGMLRLIPGVVGKDESVQQDSFMGPFVDYPEYTDPVEWHGMVVPEIIRSGNHQLIREWRENTAAEQTVLHHFQWLRSHALTAEQKKRAAKHIPHHYIALLHSDVRVGTEKQSGTTSVTSIDIHDIARSSCTYGIKQFFIVTPLKDQQEIVKKFFSFWQTEEGASYNENRHQAMSLVSLQESADQVIKAIEHAEGKKPVIIATSARAIEGVPRLSYYDQERVWAAGRPVVILLGTGSGITDELLRKADYILGPLEGFADFNHLSVRSAAAIILDRWLGISTSM